LEIIQRLRATISAECSFHAFRRAVNVSRVEHGAAEPCEKNIKNRDRSREIALSELGLHFFGYEIMSDEQCAHGVAQRPEVRGQRARVHPRNVRHLADWLETGEDVSARIWK